MQRSWNYRRRIEVRNLLLKIFGWIPIPKFTLKLLPRKYKRKIATSFLDMLELQDLESVVLPIILETADRKYNVNEGRKFKSTEEEVDEALKELPKLRPYRVYFMRVCERKRRELNLPV